MQIICISCGHKVDLRDAYDDYTGLIRDSTCGALLDVTTQGGSVRSVLLVADSAIPSSDSRSASYG